MDIVYIFLFIAVAFCIGFFIACIPRKNEYMKEYYKISDELSFINKELLISRGTITKLERENIDLIKANEELNTRLYSSNIEWKSIKDGPPEKNGEYLVVISHSRGSTTLYYDVKEGVWYDACSDDDTIYKVDYWANKPESPRANV